MADAIPYLALSAAALTVWILGLARLDVFRAPDVRALERLAVLRGFAARRGLVERTLERAPAAARLRTELDLQRQLALAGRSDTPMAFVTKGLTISLTVAALLFGADSAGRAIDGAWPLPPWLAIGAGMCFFPFTLLELRRAGVRRRQQASKTLGDMVMLLAVMTDARGFQLGDAIRILSRCTVDQTIRDLVDRHGFRSLVKETYRSTVEQYRLIGAAFGIEEFEKLADAASTANVGVAERDVYTRLALATYTNRLAEARMRSARAKVLVTVPVAGMLIPLLLLIGAPTFAAIANGVGGG